MDFYLRWQHSYIANSLFGQPFPDERRVAVFASMRKNITKERKENMAKYKIGITEAGDAGLDVSWADKLDSVDGAILVTKQFTPLFCEKALEHKDKLVIHATITGYGGTKIEPHVPNPDDELGRVLNLIERGFPKEKITIRVDPIIPTQKGIARAERVMTEAIKHGFMRFRVSVIDMYPYVRERFRANGIEPPYHDNFQAPWGMFKAVDEMLYRVKLACMSMYGAHESLRIEACAEPALKNVIQCGCISTYDLNLLGLEDPAADQEGFQRKNCLCYSGKTELLKVKKQCPHGCMYCYWRD